MPTCMRRSANATVRATQAGGFKPGMHQRGHAIKTPDRGASADRCHVLAPSQQTAYITGMAQVKSSSKSDPNYKVVAENRRARFDYAIESDVECGIILEGSEVKSLREGGANIAESYAAVEDGELWLVNSYIAPYKQAKTFQHEERRRRKLLISRKQLSDFWNATQRKGMTLVPLVLYFNHRGMAKIKIGVAKGKKLHDKRETAAKRDWSRQKSRLMKDHG
ncbi:SsrA-binding protein [Roseobacter denitrificans OCh 114]|nr:SsrA-binding protein, putative [Roseobacter denitrificans OCh 114]SFG19673.1 SsrA-binding protein [Roseobacter denitrificans OCh 114]